MNGAAPQAAILPSALVVVVIRIHATNCDHNRLQQMRPVSTRPLLDGANPVPAVQSINPDSVGLHITTPFVTGTSGTPDDGVRIGFGRY
jgi:hypothetical protein